MPEISILNANYENEYKILLEFSDHKKGEVDLKDFILNGMMTWIWLLNIFTLKPLKMTVVFKRNFKNGVMFNNKPNP